MDNNDQYNMRPMMDTREPKSKLGRYMIIGGLLGACVSLIDRGTRKKMGRAIDNVKDGSSSMMMNMVHDPSHVTDQLSNYLTNTANNIRRTAQDVTDDMRQMAEKVTGMTQSTKQAYQYAMEAGGEITEIASKIRSSGSTFNMSSANTPALVSDVSNSTYSSSSEPNEKTPLDDSGYSVYSNFNSDSTDSSSNASNSFGQMNESSSSPSNSKTTTSSTSSSSNSKMDEAELMETAQKAMDELNSDK